MSNYLNHIKNLYDDKTFQRKVEYIRYNFSKYVEKVSKKDVSFLEIGPGMGEFVSYLNIKSIYNIDIIDNDINVINFIKSNYKIKNSLCSNNINLISKKLKNYDLILLTQVFEHISKEGYTTFLQTLYKHLNKNGYIIITVPNAGNPLGLIERYYDLTHQNAFTETSLRQLINICNIKDCEITIKGYKIPPYNLLNMIRILFQKFLYLFFLILYVINGGVYTRIYNPNITLIIKKK